MNNVTFLHTIYVDFEPRAVFDGSLQGFTKALNKISPELSLSDLTDLDLMYGDEMMCDDELGEYLESSGAYWGEDYASDGMGIYFSLPLSAEEQRVEDEMQQLIEIASKQSNPREYMKIVNHWRANSDNWNANRQAV